MIASDIEKGQCALGRVTLAGDWWAQGQGSRRGSVSHHSHR